LPGSFFVKNISIIIPVYNEELCILDLIHEINTVLEFQIAYEIIIVDDASTDSTNLKLKNYIDDSLQDIKLLKNSRNLGQSKSILNGIRNAKFNNIITIDGDGQNNPKDIINLSNIYFNEDFDLVAGIRLKRRDNFVKIVSSRIANFVRAKYLKDGCKDTGCSLKIFKKNIFLNFQYFDGIHRFIPALFVGFKYKVFYCNVDHRSRKAGISKYGTISRLINGIKDMLHVKKILKKI